MFLTVTDIENILFNGVYSILGVDIMNLEKYPPSMLISKVDIQQALLFYYTIRPYQSTISINQMLQPTKDVNVQEFKPSLDDEWYCMGPMGEGMIFNMTQNMMDARLLGIFRNYFYVDPLQQAYVSTSINNNMGRPEFTFDPLSQTLRIVTGGQAIVSIKLAWCSFNLQRFPPNHFQTLSKMISIPYYERVLANRDQVSFESDFSMNTGLLRSKLDLTREELKQWQKVNRPAVILKG